MTDAASGTPRANHGTWWLLFLALSVMAIGWSLTIPLMGAPDEPAQVVKAVAVADGQLTTEVVPRRSAVGFLAFTVPDTHVRVPKAYSTLNVLTVCWLHHAEVPVACAPPVGGSETEVDAVTYVGTYPPTYYLLAGWPSRLFGPEQSLYAMRIASGVVCAALLASGLTAALRLGSLVVAGAALAITPMTLFLTGSINPNALEIAAAFCLWAVLVELVSRTARAPVGSIATATVAALLLTGSRPLSPALLLTVVVVVGLLAGSRAGLRRLWADLRVRIAAGIVGVFAVLSTVFVIVNDSLSSFIVFENAQRPSRLDIARDALGATGDRVEQAIGVLSWVGPDELHLPHLMVEGWIAAVVLLVGLALVVGTWRDRAVLVTIVAGCLALPVVSQAASANGVDWQGRYGLPLLVGVPIAAGWIAERSGRVARAAQVWIGTACVAAVAVAYLLAHQRLMTRNVLGAGHPLLAGLSDGVWDGPWSPLTLFLVLAAASVVYGAVLIWPMWRDETRAGGGER